MKALIDCLHMIGNKKFHYTPIKHYRLINGEPTFAPLTVLTYDCRVHLNSARTIRRRRFGATQLGAIRPISQNDVIQRRFENRVEISMGEVDLTIRGRDTDSWKSKNRGGTKLNFGVENSKMQIIAQSKELFKLRRITPKSAWLDNFYKVMISWNFAGKTVFVLLRRVGRAWSSLHDGRASLAAVLASLAAAVAKRRPSFRSTCPASSAAAKTFFRGDRV